MLYPAETGAVFQAGNRLGTGLDEDFFTPKPTELTEKHVSLRIPPARKRISYLLMSLLFVCACLGCSLSSALPAVAFTHWRSRKKGKCFRGAVMYTGSSAMAIPGVCLLLFLVARYALPSFAPNELFHLLFSRA